jgi:hypothetical protein
MIATTGKISAKHTNYNAKQLLLEDIDGCWRDWAPIYDPSLEFLLTHRFSPLRRANQL